MLKTNSKKYLQNMENYLLGQIDGDGYDIEVNTPLEKINFVFECYENEYECEYERRRTPNYQERFAEWLSGLPSAIHLPCYYGQILELAKELQEVKEDYPDKVADRINANYFNFMAYHIIKLRNKTIN
tara:strand:- start:202 stop:585 length:384 start_codon:yes stop_codon:yes gene_type:complete